MSEHALHPNAIAVPSRIIRLRTGLFRARRTAASQAKEVWEGLTGLATRAQAQQAALARRAQVALDPEVSRTVAAYAPVEGAALRQGRAVVFAPAIAGEGVRALPVVRTLDAAHRSAVSSHWVQQGSAGLARVAALSRQAVELLALGAPADLLARTHAAAADAARDADDSFALASSLCGLQLGAAAWPGAGRAAKARAGGRVRLAEEALLEACLGEGFAAAASTAAQLGDVEAPCASYHRNRADGAQRHAELGWAALAWALESGGEEVARAVAFALRHLPTALPEPREARLRIDQLARFGVLPPHKRLAIYLSARAQVIARASLLLDGVPARG